MLEKASLYCTEPKPHSPRKNRLLQDLGRDMEPQDPAESVPFGQSSGISRLIGQVRRAEVCKSGVATR